LFSSHIRELPQQIQKSIEESKNSSKAQHRLLEELAGLRAERMLAQAGASPRVIVSFFADRDLAFIKLLAQKLTTQPDVVALLASGAGQLGLVFAQTPGMKSNMGQLMKDTMAKLGGRGGGSADMAQGGLPPGPVDQAKIEAILRETAARL
jgi:alanyl-tRNA synthetase